MNQPDSTAGALTPAQWARLEEVLAAAIELPTDERAALVARACGNDERLRAEVESLLVAHDRPGVLDVPIVQRSASGDVHGERLAVGTIVSHYEILELLGSGGMGVVYRARDQRLERTVALKFLPAALSEDAHAKHRFLIEARAAAVLEHANVCTIHEIGETEAGQLFIAMAFIDGESLRRLMDRGPLPVSRAVAIARQLAAALHAAHEHGIVHRDVKPANVMLTRDGSVKLVDFGVAKLEGSTLTGAGGTPGTMSYMSPEQVYGEAVDGRTDVWATGVVLFEMLAGHRPFAGDTDAATLHAITSATPKPLNAARADVPALLERVVARTLEKSRDRRIASAAELDAALHAVESGTGVAMRRMPRSRTLVRAGVVAAVILAVVVVVGTSAWRGYKVRRAVASLPEIARLAVEGRYAEAHALAQRAQGAIAADTTLRRLMEVVEDRLTIVTQPEGAHVWLRRVAEDGSLAPDSMDAGLTPIRDLPLARADYRVDLRKPGFVAEARIASSALNRAEASLGVAAAITLAVPLRPASDASGDMAFVPGSPYTLVGRGAPTHARVVLPDFLVDAHEVTNEQFRTFVAAGGYAEAKYWRQPFVLDGRTLPWAEGIRRLVDRTGLPGPRGWSGQDFPSGEGRRPVTGVSWYEAAAYAEFAGKRLPTIFEWEKAARDGRFTHFDQVVMPWGLTDPMRGTSRRANFNGTGPEDVDRHPSGISPFGAYNMAGNVEEWAANATGGRRFITGGAWDDPMYVFPNFLSVSPWHASASLGFRCVRPAPGATGDPGAFDIPVGGATPVYRPVDDATYATLLRHYAYDRLPLDAVVVDTVTTPDWTRETIAITGPWRDRTTLDLYLPLRVRRPLQTIVFLPGSNTFLEIAPPDETEQLMGAHVKAGRAVLVVHFKGMVGRPWDDGRRVPATSSVQYAQEFIMHVTEMRRAIDYLESRPDIDVSRLAYIGFSLGSGSWIAFAAVEPRFRSVVLIGGGIDETFLPARPEVRHINFASHIRAPTLLLNGEYDEEHPWQRRGLPLWNLLRQPKRVEIVEGGHLPPAVARVPAINRWLDETLGPVR